MNRTRKLERAVLGIATAGLLQIPAPIVMAQEISPPSSFPPAGFNQGFWIDDRGCRYLRVTRTGTEQWVPQVRIDGKHICNPKDANFYVDQSVGQPTQPAQTAPVQPRAVAPAATAIAPTIQRSAPVRQSNPVQSPSLGRTQTLPPTSTQPLRGGTGQQAAPTTTLPPPSTNQLNAVPSGPRVVAQAGSYGSSANAQSARNLLYSQGFNVAVQQKGGRYVVYAEVPSDRDGARQELEFIKALGFNDAFLTNR